MKKILLTVLVVCILVFMYWIISPLFTSVVVHEDFPSDISMQVEGVKVQMSAEQLVERKGNFVGFDAIHNGTGTASIYVYEDEEGVQKRFLRFEEGFQVNNGPDLYVGFGKNGSYVSGSELSKLKGTVGPQNYNIPEGVDVSQYDSVYVWCKAFKTPFIKADLQ